MSTILNFDQLALVIISMMQSQVCVEETFPSNQNPRNVSEFASSVSADNVRAQISQEVKDICPISPELI